METEAGKVVKVRAGTTYYWSFAKTLLGKDPLDALQLTQRLSGMDFIPHSVAAARALEKIAGLNLSVTGALTRNILLALDIIYGNITNFYQNALPDYIAFPGTGPFNTPAGAYRPDPGVSERMLANAWTSFDIRQLIHHMAAVSGGKGPHICNVVFGGVTKSFTRAEIVRMKSLLKKVAGFINGRFTEDLGQIERSYPEYFNIGTGSGRLLTVGEFDRRNSAGFEFPARVAGGSGIMEADTGLVRADYESSRFEMRGSDGAPLTTVLDAAPGKAGAYSWVIGAVYDGLPYETGALARMHLSGNTAVAGLAAGGRSVLGRHRSRLAESRMLANKIDQWLDQINQEDPDTSIAVKSSIPDQGEAVGTAEGAMGAVVHHVFLNKGRIAGYTVLDAFSWNLCPRTRGGQSGPLEEALTGLNAVKENLIEVYRTVRSF